MPRDTNSLRSLLEGLKDVDRQARAVTVELIQEEDVLARVGNDSTKDLRQKYNLDGMGA